MKTKTVEITRRDIGSRVHAELLVCPECEGQEFLVYIPEGVDHTHFQCVQCGTSFCDGCHEGGPAH